MFGMLAFCVNAATSCSVEEAKAAETEASSLQDWDAVFKAYRRYGHCDDAAIAEGYSETVGRLLAHHWDKAGRLGILVRQDVGFRQFVLHHIDDTVPQKYLERIEKNAESSCPKGQGRLCHEILKRVRE